MKGPLTGLEKAKRAVERRVGDDAAEHRWIVAGQYDPHGLNTNRVDFHVLDGSPPRGFVIAMRHRAIALTRDGRRIRAFASRED
jgi:hypothetical protein